MKNATMWPQGEASAPLESGGQRPYSVAMAGLWKTIALFAGIAALLWLANRWDVQDKFPAIDAVFWTCAAILVPLLIRAVVEVLRTSRAGTERFKDSRTGEESIRRVLR